MRLGSWTDRRLRCPASGVGNDLPLLAASPHTRSQKTEEKENGMRYAIASALVGLALVALYGDAVAQGLPKTGSISWHTGWRSVGEAWEVAKGRVEGHGSVIGTSFNDKGSGPLH